MKSVAEYNQAIEQARSTFEEYQTATLTMIENLQAELGKQKQTQHETIINLQRERDALALAEKLKEFPEALRNAHPACSVCNGQMRPFRVAGGLKYWACENGNLEESHDLFVVVPES